MRKFFVIILLLFFVLPAVAAEPLVKRIDVQGLRRIDEYAVRSKISQKVGSPLSPDKISEDIKNIFNMNYFDDVRVEMEFYEGGVRLIYIVVEKPTISSINFHGNEEYDDDKLREQILISRGSIADATLIQENALKIKAFYESKGYWLAEIVPVVHKVSETSAVVTYMIKEGNEVSIDTIKFEGNRSLSDGEIEDVMETSEWWIFSWLTQGGRYDSQKMKRDLEAIRNLYFNNGFINVRVSEPEIHLDEDKEEMNITIAISEGKQYSVASVGLVDNKAYSDKELMRLIKMRPGDIFRRNILSEDIRALSEFYSERGYALISIDPQVQPVRNEDKVDVIYRVIEGDIYHIGRIEIGGNIKTKDKVIRRELRLDEGDLYDSSKIKRSYQRLNNLNFFENIELKPKPRPSENLLDIDVTVKDKQTGTFTVGGGYSTLDKFIGMVDLSYGNFLGNGQDIKLRGEFSSRSTTYELSFHEPWFMDKEISMTASVYRKKREYTDYDWKSKGFRIGFGKAFREYWQGSVQYTLEEVTVSNVDENAIQDIKDLEGINLTSEIAPSIARDTRDYYLDPHEGSRNALYLSFAGLGGDNKYFKAIFDSQWFFPFGPTTFGVRGRAGYAVGLFGKKLPNYEKFYVGGINTVRGLDYGDGGPKDANGTPIGGSRQLIFNFEYIFPLIPDAKLKGLIFFDAGQAFEKGDSLSLRRTTGLGIRWISPVGPLRLEWGYNLDPKEDERKSKFEFTFGTFF